MRLAPPPTAASLRALLLTPALTCRRSMASTAAIEVERKFAASDPSALRQRVEANGGQVLGEKAFNDQYWDNAQCTLTRRDTWLRRRQDQWELKVPIVGSRRSGGETTSFREIEGEPRHARTPSMRRCTPKPRALSTHSAVQAAHQHDPCSSPRLAFRCKVLCLRPPRCADP